MSPPTRRKVARPAVTLTPAQLAEKLVALEKQWHEGAWGAARKALAAHVTLLRRGAAKELEGYDEALDVAELVLLQWHALDGAEASALVLARARIKRFEEREDSLAELVSLSEAVWRLAMKFGPEQYGEALDAAQQWFELLDGAGVPPMGLLPAARAQVEAALVLEAGDEVVGAAAGRWLSTAREALAEAQKAGLERALLDERVDECADALLLASELAARKGDEEGDEELGRLGAEREALLLSRAVADPN